MKFTLIITSLLAFAGLTKSQPNFEWAKSFSGTGQGSSVTKDATGNFYVCGGFSGTVDFDAGPGIFNVTATGSNDGYIEKLDQNGNMLWVKTIGSVGSGAYYNLVKIDAVGNIILTGGFSNTLDFNPGPGTNNLTSNGNGDFFIEKLDPNGNYIWAKSMGGTFLDALYGLVIDPTNNIYVAGFYESTVDFDPNSGVYNITSSGQRDVFLVKLNPLGNLAWAKSFGGPTDEYARALTIDVSGSVLLCGEFTSTVDFDPGLGTNFLTSPAGFSGYISKFDSNGNLIFAKGMLCNAGGVSATSIITDPVGSIYSTGYFSGNADFDPGLGVLNITTTGLNDVFVLKLDINGNYTWAEKLGGTGIDNGNLISLDQDNNIFVCGNFQSMGADFDPGASSYTLNSNGGFDVFINKLDNNGNFLCAGSIGSVFDESVNSSVFTSGDDLLLAGWFKNSMDFDPGSGSYSITPSGFPEPFLVKFKSLIIIPASTNTLCSGSAITVSVTGANSYTWQPSYALNVTTGSFVIANPMVTTTYTINGSTGCYKTQTALTMSVLTKPDLTAPVSPQKLLCNPDSILLQSTSTNTNVLFQWRKATSPTYTNQPYYSKSSGNYYGKVLDLNNGCADSSLVSLLDFQIPPNAKITSHAYVSALSPIDTITCYKPTINVLGASDTSGVTITWKNIASNSLLPNPANVNALGNFKLIVKRNDNQCADSSIIALINQNTILPGVTIASVSPLSCSIYSTTINAAYSPANCMVYWLNPVNSVLVNPTFTSLQGKHKFFATDPINGCTKSDSITVLKTNNLQINTSADTTVCKNSPVTLSALPITTVTGISYLWNSGQTTNTITAIPSTTTQYVITASSPGCLGSATININVPEDIQDSIITYKACNNTNGGSLVVYVKGGVPPYKFSINNGVTFSQSNTFSNLLFGNYSVTIRDSLGCIKQSSAALTPLSNLPEPKFLASTKNYVRDTIVFIDISSPKADSVQWMLPSIAKVIGGDMFNPVILFNDTGSFNVTTKSFYGNCIISSTKFVHFAKEDSLNATRFNENGIKNVSLYPNPNNGIFSIDVEFYKKQNINLVILDVNSSKVFQKDYSNTLIFTEPINLSALNNGVYLVRVIGEYDSQSKTIIINK